MRNPPAGDEFYVNYLPTPAGYARFTKWLAVVLVAMFAGFGLALAANRRDAGPATWDTAQSIHFTGVLRADPYPTLELTQPADGLPQGATLLVVELGKRGAAARCRPLDGRIVRLSGWLLQRGSRRMLELEEPAGAVTDLGPAPAPSAISPSGSTTQRTTLIGEIVDSKCYLGAMKPGDGRTHKECATLCVSGGVPPVLVTRDEAGHEQHYLLADEHGHPLGRELLPLIAEPVRISGSITRRGDLSILRCIQSDIVRITSAQGD